MWIKQRLERSKQLTLLISPWKVALDSYVSVNTQKTALKVGTVRIKQLEEFLYDFHQSFIESNNTCVGLGLSLSEDGTLVGIHGGENTRDICKNSCYANTTLMPLWVKGSETMVLIGKLVSKILKRPTIKDWR